MCLCDCAKDRWLVFKWSLVLVLIKRYDVKKLSPLAEHYSNCLTLHYTRNCKKPFCKIKLILSMQPFCQKRLFISLILALICSIHMERIIIWFMKMRQTRTKKEETVLMFLRFLPMLPVRVKCSCCTAMRNTKRLHRQCRFDIDIDILNSHGRGALWNGRNVLVYSSLRLRIGVIYTDSVDSDSGIRTGYLNGTKRWLISINYTQYFGLICFRQLSVATGSVQAATDVYVWRQSFNPLIIMRRIGCRRWRMRCVECWIVWKRMGGVMLTLTRRTTNKNNFSLSDKRDE